jgi:hydrogenase expression/formation protein HypC
MCLAFPMCIASIDGLSATCAARGSERAVSLWLLQDEPLAVGDWVLVHLNRAIQRISAAEAQAAWLLFDELLAELPEHPLPAVG